VRLLAERIWDRGTTYATTHMPHALSEPTLSGTLLDNWAWLVLNAILMTIGFGLMWRRWRGAAVYVGGYVALVLAWTWFSGRLLVPMVPLGLLAILLGARWLAGRLPRPTGWIAAGAVPLFLVVGAVASGVERYTMYADCDRGDPYESSGCYAASKRALAAAARFLRSNADPADIVLTDQPASVNYLSGLATEGMAAWFPRHRGNVEDVVRSRKIGFILVRTRFSQCAASSAWWRATCRMRCSSRRGRAAKPVPMLAPHSRA
jgi:hypothetical protein